MRGVTRLLALAFGAVLSVMGAAGAAEKTRRAGAGFDVVCWSSPRAPRLRVRTALLVGFALPFVPVAVLRLCPYPRKFSPVEAACVVERFT